jgi:hypothetical protein
MTIHKVNSFLEVFKYIFTATHAFTPLKAPITNDGIAKSSRDSSRYFIVL